MKSLMLLLCIGLTLSLVRDAAAQQAAALPSCRDQFRDRPDLVAHCEARRKCKQAKDRDGCQETAAEGSDVSHANEQAAIRLLVSQNARATATATTALGRKVDGMYSEQVAVDAKQDRRIERIETRSSTVTVGEFPLTLSLAAGVHVGLGDGPLGLFGVVEVEGGFKLVDRALIPHLALALGWGGDAGRGMFNPKAGVALRLWPFMWDSKTKSSYVTYVLLRLQYLAYDRRSSVPGAGVEAFGAEIGARLTHSWWLIDITFSPVNATFAYKDEQGRDLSGPMVMWAIRAGGTF